MIVATSACAGENPAEPSRWQVLDFEGTGFEKHRVFGVGEQIWVGDVAGGVHFDGSTWTAIDTVVPKAVFVAAEDDLWAVDAEALLRSTDGITWTPVDLASITASLERAIAVFGSSAADVWLVAAQADGEVVFRWDGVTWTEQVTFRTFFDQLAVFEPYLTGGCAPDETDVLITGNDVVVDWEEGLVLRWAGAEWTYQGYERAVEPVCRGSRAWLIKDVGNQPMELFERVDGAWISHSPWSESLVRDVAPSATPGEAWVLTEADVGIGEECWHISPDGDGPCEFPTLNTVISVWVTDSGRLFAFASDGAIAEYVE